MVEQHRRPPGLYFDCPVCAGIAEDDSGSRPSAKARQARLRRRRPTGSGRCVASGGRRQVPQQRFARRLISAGMPTLWRPQVCHVHRIDRGQAVGAAAAVPVVCRSNAGRRQADGSRSDVVFSGVVRAHETADMTISTRMKRVTGRGIIAPRRTSSAHLRRPWRANYVNGLCKSSKRARRSHPPKTHQQSGRWDQGRLSM
jgi:hypothetical protein